MMVVEEVVGQNRIRGLPPTQLGNASDTWSRPRDVRVGARTLCIVLREGELGAVVCVYCLPPRKEGGRPLERICALQFKNSVGGRYEYDGANIRIDQGIEHYGSLHAVGMKMGGCFLVEGIIFAVALHGWRHKDGIYLALKRET